MLVYLLASLFISASAIVGVVYFLDQLFYRPDVIYPKTYGDYLTHIEIGNSSFVYVYTISSAIAFVLLWTGTVFLLHSYRKKLGRWKYWILMSIPLLYFRSSTSLHIPWIDPRGTWKSVISRFVAYSFVRCYDHILMYVEHVELGFN